MNVPWKKWLAGAAAALSCALAMAWPVRPVTVVVGYAAGGPADVLARLVAQRLTQELGQPFVVDNKPGANGNLGAAAVARAPADGYTLLFGGSNHVTNTHLYQKLPFDFTRDFIAVGMVATFPNILVVHPALPAASVGQLVALARERPGRLSFASSGIGSSPHLAGELFMQSADVKMVHVPYKGAAPAVTDLVGGNIDLMFLNAPAALALARENKVRALGVTGEVRSRAAPELPTVAEGGLRGYAIAPWLGFFAPAKVPAEVAQTLNRAIARVVAQPEVASKLQDESADPIRGDLAQLARFLAQDDAKWAKVVKDSGAKLD